MKLEELKNKNQEELEKMASNKDYTAIYELANRYRNMAILPEDNIYEEYKKSGIFLDNKPEVVHVKLYRRAKQLCEEENSSNSNCYLGMLYYYNYIAYNGNNYDKAKSYFESSYKDGNSLATEFLGRMYYYGKGVEKDYSKAIEYFKKCENEENNSSKYLLGVMHYYGEGVKQDYLKAKEYFENSLSEKSSNYFLGCMYYFGEGVDVDYTKARKYFETESKYGDTESIYYLGEIYSEGLGTNKDENKAQEYFSKIEKDYLLSVIYYCLGLEITDYDKIVEIINYDRDKFEEYMGTIPVEHPASIVYKKLYYLTDNQYEYIRNFAKKKLENYNGFNIKDKFSSEKQIEEYVSRIINNVV